MSYPILFPLPPPPPLEFAPLGAPDVRYASFVGVTGDKLELLNTPLLAGDRVTPLVTLKDLSATVDVDAVLMPEKWRVYLYVYCKTPVKPFLQEVHNPTPAPWGRLGLTRFRPVVTGAWAEDSLTVTGTLPKALPVVRALIVLRGLMAPNYPHSQQTYNPRYPDTGGGGSDG